MGVRAASLTLCATALGCNLVVSLDELQDGSGGAASTASAPQGPVGPGPSGSNASGSVTSTGTGGSVDAYAACVAAHGPALHLRLASPADGGVDDNLGTWGGTAVWSGSVGPAPALVTNGDGAAVFDPDGALAFTPPDFFGGYQPFTIELWFTVPAAYAQPVVRMGTALDGFEVTIEERQDPMGLDLVRFRFRSGGTMERLVTEYADFAGTPGPHHLAVVYRQTAGTVFVNGEADDLLLYLDGQEGPNPGAGNEIAMPQYAGDLTFGNGFAGPLDEIAVYPSELSAGAVDAHARLGRGEDVPCPAPD